MPSWPYCWPAALAAATAICSPNCGTPNEQLRAHYILGRTYADMGEAPHAVECFQES